MPETASQYAVRDLWAATPASLTVVPANDLTLYERHFYRLTCKTPSGLILKDIVESGDQRVTEPLNRYFRKNQRDFRLSLKFNGTPLLVMKRRWWGVRCPRCFDLITKKVVRADCSACWGTGFTGGYWTPTSTYGRRTVNANNSAITPDQKMDSNGVRFWLPDFPTLERDDILISLKTQRRYRVDEQVDTELQLVGVHQILTCQEIPKDHLLYRMKVQPDTVEPLY